MVKWQEIFTVYGVFFTGLGLLGAEASTSFEDRDIFQDVNYKSSSQFNEVQHVNSVTKNKFERMSDVFKSSITKLKQKDKKIDLVFLLDSSSSVGKINFKSEIQFVKKVLADLTVAYNHTRVAVVTFSSAGKVVSQ